MESDLTKIRVEGIRAILKTTEENQKWTSGVIMWIITPAILFMAFASLKIAGFHGFESEIITEILFFSQYVLMFMLGCSLLILGYAIALGVLFIMVVLYAWLVKVFSKDFEE